MTPIALRGLHKRFGRTVAVDRLDLEVAAGDLFFLLGPSGCGKTTVLRMVAGFSDPTAGTIHFDDRDITRTAANRRNCGMVFQNYALWPHMTVRQNVAFGLEVRRIVASERDERVLRALRTVQMHDYAERRPNELSGGQQQRVALARALVIEPTVLLLDEPLSNLDAKLRLSMRGQIRQICKDAGTTAIYVTHDQKEALSMADRVAVLSEGRLMQVGSPRDLYDRPASRFVADFLGEANFLPAEIVGREGPHVLLDCPAGRLIARARPEDVPGTGNVTCAIRPEALRVVREAGGPDAPVNQLEGRCLSVTYLGEMAQYEVGVGDAITLKIVELNPRQLADADRPVRVRFDPEDLVILQD